MFLAVSLFSIAALTLLLAERDYYGIGMVGMAERGLTFVVLLASCIIASVLMNVYESGKYKRLRNCGVLVLVVLLTLSFPFIAYRSEATWTYPVSEKEGLRFLAENVPLDGRTLAMGGARQLVFFPEAAFSSPQLQRTGNLETDITPFRRTDYYSAAMSRDLSFEDNAFTRHLALIAGSNNHNKVYSNPAFEVFLKAPK